MVTVNVHADKLSTVHIYETITYINIIRCKRLHKE